MEKDTFLIANGKINAKNLEESAEELRFTLEEGYSDQNVINSFENVKVFGEAVKEKLKKAV